MADVARAFIPSVPEGWFMDASTSRPSSGNVAQALRLDGCLDLEALRKSVEFLIGRYQTLWNIPGQSRAASRDVLPIQDFGGLPIDTRESEARRYIHQQADCPLDLKDGPLLHAALARLSASENILLISMHRSLCGAGVLMSTLTAELSERYNAEVGTALSPLPQSPARQLTVSHPDAIHGASNNGKQDNGKPGENTAEALERLPNGPPRAATGGVFGRESHMLPEALMASRTGIQQGGERGAVHHAVRGFCSAAFPA